MMAAFSLVPAMIGYKLGVPRDFMDWFAYQTMQIDAESAELFIGYMLKPSGLGQRNPIFCLNERLRELHERKLRGHAVSNIEQAVHIAKAWNLYYDNQPAENATAIRYRRTEKWPGIKGA